MFQLDTFIVEGHQKNIDHYRWLRDISRSEAERERFQRGWWKNMRPLSVTPSGIGAARNAPPPRV
jgi:hypothetical protein